MWRSFRAGGRWYKAASEPPFGRPRGPGGADRRSRPRPGVAAPARRRIRDPAVLRRAVPARDPAVRCGAARADRLVAASIALGPVLLVATADAGLPGADAATDPTPATLVQDPLGLLVQLLKTGDIRSSSTSLTSAPGWRSGGSTSPPAGSGGGCSVPAPPWRSRPVPCRLIVLYPLGGLARLTTQDGAAGAPNVAVGPPAQLVVVPRTSCPPSYTPVDVAHVLGSAMAVLGAALLLTLVRVVARLLRPLAVAGTMALTLYSAHLVVLATGVLEDRPRLLFVLMVSAALGSPSSGAGGSGRARSSESSRWRPGWHAGRSSGSLPTVRPARMDGKPRRITPGCPPWRRTTPAAFCPRGRTRPCVLGRCLRRHGEDVETELNGRIIRGGGLAASPIPPSASAWLHSSCRQVASSGCRALLHARLADRRPRHAVSGPAGDISWTGHAATRPDRSGRARRDPRRGPYRGHRDPRGRWGPGGDRSGCRGTGKGRDVDRRIRRGELLTASDCS